MTHKNTKCCLYYILGRIVGIKDWIWRQQTGRNTYSSNIPPKFSPIRFSKYEKFIKSLYLCHYQFFLMNISGFWNQKFVRIINCSYLLFWWTTLMGLFLRMASWHTAGSDTMFIVFTYLWGSLWSFRHYGSNVALQALLL